MAARERRKDLISIGLDWSNHIRGYYSNWNHGRSVWVLVAITTLLTSGIVLTYNVPIGSDIHFHLKIARVWAMGGNGMFSDIALTVNRMPYPPLFHLILTPSIWFNSEILFSRIVQALTYPFALLSFAYYMKKTEGDRPALIGTLLLMGSLAYFDRLLQATPQGIDFILFPFALLEVGGGVFPLASILLVYNHGIVGALMLGGSLIQLLYERRFKFLFLIGVLTLPISIPSVQYLVQGLGRMAGTATNAQELAFWKNPLIWGGYYLGVLALVAPFALLWVENATRAQRISLLTLVGLLPMFPFWPERFLSYATIPLAHLAATMLKPRHLLFLSPVIAYNILQPWIWLLTDNFHVITP